MEKKEAQEHVGTLRRLQEKDPEFYEFLKEHDKELLEFDEDDIDDDDGSEFGVGDDEDDEDEAGGDDDDDEDEAGGDIHEDLKEDEDEPSRNIITSDLVDSWSDQIRHGAKLGAVRSLLRAFRSACHYGDDSGNDPSAKFSTMSSSVFNKIMLLVLTEMDGVFRGLLNLTPAGGKKETIEDLMSTKRWKKYSYMVKSYLANSLHVLNQMTDNEMIAFTLKRLKDSSVFLAAFPALLRKYIKVALHFWGTGSGALPVVSFLFLRDSCIRLGSDCLSDCIRGMYKAYVLNCHFTTSTKLQHIQFLSNCFIELLQVDISSTYQHAFTYIRQLAMILKEALSSPANVKRTKKKGKEENQSSKKEKGKEAMSNTKKRETFRRVYQWKYINCLELWTGVVCACSSEPDLRSLAYPLSQIITGVARLVPSACYFPLRLRCVRMLNRLGASTDTFIPVSVLLMDMLEIKELRKLPTGGAGKAIDLFSILKVSKSMLKTRAFQEACVFSVVDELTEHLAQWSYSIAFMELSFIPCVRLRNFCKSTKVDRFRREMKGLLRQIEANSNFINKERTTISFLPNDPAAELFLEDEKKSGISPLSKYAAILRQKAQERNDALEESSVLVGEHSSKFDKKRRTDDDDGSDDEDDGYESEESADTPLLPSQKQHQKGEKKKNHAAALKEETAFDEDVIEDFVLSSDDDDDISVDDDAIVDEEGSDSEKSKPARNKKRKHHHQAKQHSRDKAKFNNNKSKKRKRVHGKSSKS